MNELRKHLTVYRAFIRNCLMTQMEYRANFILNLLLESLYLGTKLFYVLIAYNAESETNGISAVEVKFFVGTFILITAVYTGFFMENFYAISRKVHRGDLDLMLCKPISSQFYLTMNGVNMILPIPNIIAGTVLVSSAWKELEITVSVGNILLYIGMLIAGTLVTYSLFLLPQLLAFRIVNTGSIVEITDRFWDFNSMPMTIYTKWMQRVGVFLIPLFFITNYPVMAVLRRMSTIDWIWAFVCPVALFFIVRLVWHRSIRHYTSTGS